MEFTEISELNDIIHQSQISKPSQLNRYNYVEEFNYFFDNQQNQIETLLQDSPKASEQLRKQKFQHNINNLLNQSKNDLLSENNDETEEDILQDIRVSWMKIIEQEQNIIRQSSQNDLQENKSSNQDFPLKKGFSKVNIDQGLIVQSIEGEQKENQKQPDNSQQASNKQISDNQLNLDLLQDLQVSNKKSIVVSDVIDFTQTNEQNNQNNQNEEDKQKTFDKQNIQSSLVQRSSMLSSLSLQNQGKSQGRSSRSLMSQKGQNQNLKKIKVFFFITPYRLITFVDIQLTVEQVIKELIDCYMNEESSDKNLMKYACYPQAYELRILEDDLDCHPEMSFDALEGTKRFIDYNLDCLAFIEIPGFKPPSQSTAYDPNDTILQEKEKKIEQIAQQKNSIILDITLIDENNYNTLLNFDPDQKVSDIFIKLHKKNYKYNPKKMIIKCMPTDQQFFSDLAFEPEEVFSDMPLKSLKSTKLHIQKKKFADEPNQKQEKLYQYSQSSIVEFNNSDQGVLNDGENSESNQYFQQLEFLLNEVQACKYEEFEVIKINNRGNRQDRILGIDQFKLYNKESNTKNNKTIGDWLNYKIKGTYTKIPERLIETIESLSMISNNQFQLIVTDKEVESNLKKMNYETKNPKTASYIYAKLDYLMKMQKKNKSSSTIKIQNQRDHTRLSIVENK